MRLFKVTLRAVLRARRNSIAGSLIAVSATAGFVLCAPPVLAGSPSDPLTRPNLTAPATVALQPGLALLGEGLEAGALLVNPPTISVESLFGDGDPLQLDHRLIGGRIGWSAAWAVLGITDTPFLLEWNTGVGFAQAMSSSATALSSLGSSFSTGTAPTGSITIDTSTVGGVASASVVLSVTDGTGDSANITSSAVSPSGQVSQSAVSTTAEGGGFVAVTTDSSVPSAAGYGAIYDGDGFRFDWSGDAGASQLETRITDQMFSLDQEFLFTAPLSQTEDWSFSLKAGPSYRFATRSITQRQVFNLDETVSNSVLPAIGVSNRDRIQTHYFGVVAGLGATHRFAEDWQIGFGGNFGVSAYHAQHDFRSTVVGVNVAHVPAQTASQSMTGIMARVAGRIDLTHFMEQGHALTFSLFGEERFGVPTLEHSGGSTRLTTGNAWEAGVGIAYSIRF